MISPNLPLFDGAVEWLGGETNIKSAVLFGSSASHIEAGQTAGIPTDFDFHLIVSNAAKFERIEWDSAMPNEEFCFQAYRNATGGVRKLTVIFKSGQIDLVVVPLSKMRLAAIGFRCGLYKRLQFIRQPMDEMATCLHSGYRFIKGSLVWRRFYSAIAALPGVRLSDVEIRSLADVALCEILWVFHKLDAGELVAAQHVLHSRLSDTNLRLWRELRRRNGLHLPSFGLGRRLEVLADNRELSLLSLSSRLVQSELRAATWIAFESLSNFMGTLDKTWCVPRSLGDRLQQYR